MTLSIGTAVIIVLVVLIVKFGVLDQLARQSAAESAYNTVHAQYTEMQSAVEKYPRSKRSTAPIPENGCSRSDSGAFVSVDRQEVLDLMENYLQPYGTIKAVTISDDVMIVSMSGMNLQEISAMFEILQQQPIVKAADLTIASTEKTAGEDLDFSVTITLQPADAAEGGGHSMKRAFTTREKVMLLVLTVLLIVIAYFKLILEPINNSIDEYQSETAAEQDEILQNTELLTRMSQMQKELEEILPRATPRRFRNYDNSGKLLVELNSILFGFR